MGLYVFSELFSEGKPVAIVLKVRILLGTG
jgi:hypothetical protein